MKPTQSTSNKLELLRNVSFAEVAYEQLRDLILSGEILPGSHINENQMAEEFGINRAPVREACRQLQKEGLVDIAKNRGAFIRAIPAEEALELYEIRVSLEGLAAEKAAEVATEEEIELLGQCIEQLKLAAKAEDEPAHYRHAVEFHQIVANISGNSSLISMIDAVGSKIILFRKKLSFEMNRGFAFTEEEAIYEAIKNRNSKLAGKIIRKHVLRAKNNIAKKLREDK